MKKTFHIIAAAIAMSVLFALTASAQKERSEGIIRSALNGLHYYFRASYGIGGVSPLPLPAEIRSIEGYRPGVGLSLEGTVEKQLGKRMGLHIGLRLETRTMKTDALVKNYKMEIENGPGGVVSGYWTGRVKTNVRNSYLTIPVLLTCQLAPQWKMRVGPYFSYLISGDFSGSVFDGYLREHTPVGTKVNITSENPGKYDFSDSYTRSNWGVQVGAEWRAFSHLNIFGDLNWGLNSAFPKDFETITFKMYPIYLNIGLAYAF